MTPRATFICSPGYVEIAMAVEARCGWKRSCVVCRWRGLKWSTTISRWLQAEGLAILTPSEVRQVHREHGKRRSWRERK